MTKRSGAAPAGPNTCCNITKIHRHIPGNALSVHNTSRDLQITHNKISRLNETEASGGGKEGEAQRKLCSLSIQIIFRFRCLNASEAVLNTAVIFLFGVQSDVHYPCYTDVRQRSNPHRVSANDRTEGVVCQRGPRRGILEERSPGSHRSSSSSSS